MTDIAERLRRQASQQDMLTCEDMLQAADEIEDLRSANELLHRLISNREAEIERLTEALQQIVRWADAYPIDIFHEPTKDECHRAHELLTANGMTLDAFSASMGRHCMKGAGDIARRALEPKL